MSVQDYSQVGVPVSEVAPVARAKFIRRTYTNLVFAWIGFGLYETLLIQAGLGEVLLGLLGASKWAWIILMLVCMAGGYIASGIAQSGASRMVQYLGLALYVGVEGLIFLPLLTLASLYNPSAILEAGVMTVAVVGALTAVVFGTRTDFSFLRSFITIGFFVIMGLIVCSMIFGFGLGTIFIVGMMGFAACLILYSTSSVMNRYSSDQDAAAALDLFGSIATFFYYVLLFFMGNRDD